MTYSTPILRRSTPKQATRLQHFAVAMLVLGILIVTLGRPALASATDFASGSLIIPMDIDTTGNHASFNQNLGMWKAYGLVYRLLQNGIPVSWGIQLNKSFDDIDCSVTTVRDVRTLTALGSWDYRGGPFLIDQSNAAAALPIIRSWWASNGNLPNVHEATSSFSVEIDTTLRSPPRIANEAINARISIAYYNAAGIPDLNGNPWTALSPNIFDETEIASGALFQTGVCLQRKFDIFVTPHNSGYAYSLTDPNNLGTKTYAQLDTFVHQGGGWTALCHSILSNENYIRDLTVNSSAAVKSLFKTSLPGGQPGGFLTSSGFTSIDNTGGTWTVNPPAADLPSAQAVSTTGATQALPGGSVQTWPAPPAAGAPTYYAATERVAYFDTLTVDHDHIIAGPYHNGTGLGKLTYIGGHSFSTAVPYSGNFEAPYLRMFYNSLFFNGNAVAKLDLTYTPTTFPQNGTQPLYVSITNTGGSVATAVGATPGYASIVLTSGFTYVMTTSGPTPTVSPDTPSAGYTTLTWTNLGDVAGGTSVVTIKVQVDASVKSTAGLKEFGTFHATYGDVFGEGFTADVCREIQVSPVPAPALTKTPATQGPFIAGDAVTWTLSYGNTGAAALENAVLEDILPPGFTFSAASPAPARVIPGTPTLVRWNLGTLSPGASGTIMLTALAGRVTTPPLQTFTNNATLSGLDSTGTTYSAAASAAVTVETLDLSVGKSVDKDFVTTLPNTVTYTITPAFSGDRLLENVHVIDPLPAGTTFLSAGQGGTSGAYTPIAAVPGSDPGPPVLGTAITVSSNFVTQGGSVTVTLNVSSSVAVSNVSPTALETGGATNCTGPTPPSANVPASPGSLNFVWSCTLLEAGEYIFSAGAQDALNTTVWPSASSASVLSAPTGGPNVVTWNLGSNVGGVPGETLTSGYTAGVYGFQGNNTVTFQKYEVSANAWTAKANALGNVQQGGALTTDGAGTIYGLRGNGQQSFYAYDIDTNVWTAKANTGTNVSAGGAAVFLNVGGTAYVYATMGNGTVFKRYSVAGNSWTAMASTPNNVKKGGALTTDGTYIYALRGDNQKSFWRCNATTTGSAGSCDTSWTVRAALPVNAGWGGALTRVGGYIYALTGNGTKNFYRYDSAANTWSKMASTPANVADGGALTTDGTYIYAFQGKTTAFWRYDIAANLWTTRALFTAATNQGGALVFDPGLNPQGFFSALTASPTVMTTGGSITVTFQLKSSTAVTNVVAGTLTVTPTAGASCSSLTGPTLVSADNNIADINDPVFYSWTCVVSAGATPGSLTFSASATGAGGVTFPTAASNSVLVSPLLTFQVTLPIGAPTQVVNDALMAANEETTTSPPVTTNTGTPTLTITKSNSPGSSTVLLPGDPITYTMVVQNIGSGNATSVVVTDTVPANTVYDSCSGGTSCGASGGVVTWTIGALAPGQTATVTLTVSTTTGLAISATAYTITETASADCAETNPVSSNTVTNQLQVLPRISKSVVPEEAATGDILTYTLVVENPGAAFTADVTDVVPAGTTFGGVGTCSPACALNGSTVTWNGQTITARGTTIFSFSVTVTAPGGSLVSDSAILDPTSPDLSPIGSNQVDTPIGPDLAIVKLNNPTGEVPVGNTITYTLEVSNESNVTATNTVVTDAVPTGTTYQSCTTPVGTCGLAAGVVTWNLGNLAGFGGAVLTFTVQVGTSPPGLLQINNVAQVTASNAPAPVDSNIVSNPVQGAGTLNLLLAKSASPTTYRLGDTINYSYVLTNLGTGTLFAPFAVNDDKATATCPGTPPSLTTGQTITCTASHTITQADVDAGSLTNLATATAKDVSNQTVTSNQDTQTVRALATPTPSSTQTPTPTVTATPTPSAGAQDIVLNIAKVGEPNPVVAGTVLPYTIAYGNAGTSVAPNAVVTETYDPNVTFVDAVPTPDPGTTNRWSVGNLLPNTTGEIIVRVSVNPSTPVGTVLTNVVTIAAGGASASATETTEIAAATCLNARVSDTDLFSGDRHPGTLVRFSIRVTRQCAGVAAVQVVDPLPPSLSFVSAANRGVFANGAVTWLTKPLTDNHSVTVSFTALINANVVPGTVITNTVTVSDSLGNTATASDLIRTLRPHPQGPPDILSIRGKGPKAIAEGRSMKLFFTYKGLVVGGDVTVLLAPGEELISARPTPSSITPSGQVTWQGGTLRLPNGTLTLVVHPAMQSGTITNTAVITSTAGKSMSTSVDTLVDPVHLSVMTPTVATPVVSAHSDGCAVRRGPHTGAGRFVLALVLAGLLARRRARKRRQ